MSADATPPDADEQPEKGFRRALPKRKGKAKRSERLRPTTGKGFGTVDGLKFDRRPKSTGTCDCGGSKPYAECCEPLHEGEAAADVVSLLRARYTAYCYRLPEYLMRTTSRSGTEWHEDAAAWKKEILSFCDGFIFEGLRVEGEPVVEGDKARLSFCVSMVQKGSIKMLDSRETSTFVRSPELGWLYESGEVGYEATPE